MNFLQYPLNSLPIDLESDQINTTTHRDRQLFQHVVRQVQRDKTRQISERIGQLGDLIRTQVKFQQSFCSNPLERLPYLVIAETFYLGKVPKSSGSSVSWQAFKSIISK